MAVGIITLQLKEKPEKEKHQPQIPVQMPVAAEDNFSFSDNETEFSPLDSILPELEVAEEEHNESEITYPDYEVNGMVNYGDGLDEVRIAIIAPTMIQAKDFVCSMYCNMLSFVEGRELSLYTRDHPTILLLSEAKQNLEMMATKPVGTAIRNNLTGYNNGMHTVTVGQTGNQTVSLDIHFLCGTYSDMSAVASAESVIVLLNFYDESMSAENVNSMVSMLGNRNINWVVSGFEGEKIYYSSDLTSPPPVALRKKIKEKFNVLTKKGDTLSYVQAYGGLIVTGREENEPVYGAVRDCRDYFPIGCEYPLVTALCDIAEHRSNKGAALALMENKVKEITKAKRTSPAWKEKYKEA